MTVVEKTLGTGQTGHALDTLLHHVRGVLTGPRSVLTLNITLSYSWQLGVIVLNIYLREKFMAMHAAFLQ